MICPGLTVCFECGNRLEKDEIGLCKYCREKKLIRKEIEKENQKQKELENQREKEKKLEIFYNMNEYEQKALEEFIRRIGKEYRKKEAEKEIERLKKELGDI